jgi:hypothetical protein
MATRRFFDGATIELGLLPIEEPIYGVAGCAAQFDASDASSITFGTGTLVAGMTNLASSLNDLTQSTGTNQPDRNDTQNGLDTIIFNGTDNYLIADSDFTVPDSGCWFFFSFKASGSAGRSFIGGTSGFLQIRLDGAGALNVLRANTEDCGAGNTSTDDGKWHIASVFVSTAERIFRLDGAADGSDAVAAGGSFSHWNKVGTQIGAGEWGDFELGEILYYQKDLLITEVQAIEAALETKWLPPPTPVYGVTGCTLWLDASDSLSGGTLTDKSDNSVNGIRKAGGSFTTGTLNSLTTCVFNGSTDDMQLTADIPVPDSGFTAIAVVKVTGGGSNAILNNDGTTGTLEWRTGGTTTQELLLNNVASIGTSSSNVGSGWNILAITFTTSLRSFFLNGVADGTDSGTVASASPINAIGYGFSGSAYDRLTGEIAEIVFYDSALLSTDREAVENALAAKWFALDANISATLISSTGTTHSPILQSSVTVSAGLISATGSTFLSSLRSDASITGLLVSATGTTNSPVLSAAATTVGFVVSSTGVTNGITITTTSILAGSLVTGSGTVNNSTGAVDSSISPSFVSSAGSVFAASINSSVTLGGTVVAAVSTLNGVSITATSIVGGSVVSGTGTTNASSILSIVGITPATTLSVGSLLSPSFITTALILAGLTTGSGLISGATLVATAIIAGSSTTAIGTVNGVTGTASATIGSGLVASTSSVLSPIADAVTRVATITVAGTGTANVSTISATAVAPSSVVLGLGAISAASFTITATVTPNLSSSTGLVLAPTIMTTALVVGNLISGIGTVYAVVSSSSIDINSSVTSSTAAINGIIITTTSLINGSVVASSMTINMAGLVASAVLSPSFIIATGTISSIAGITGTASVAPGLLSSTGVVEIATTLIAGVVTVNAVTSNATVFNPSPRADLTLLAELVEAIGLVFLSLPGGNTIVDAVDLVSTSSVYAIVLNITAAALVDVYEAVGSIHNVVVQVSQTLITSLISSSAAVYTPNISSAIIASPNTTSASSVTYNISFMINGAAIVIHVASAGQVQGATTQATSLINGSIVSGSGTVGNSTQNLTSYVTLSELLGVGSTNSPTHQATAVVEPSSLLTDSSLPDPTNTASPFITLSEVLGSGVVLGNNITTSSEIDVNTSYAIYSIPSSLPISSADLFIAVIEVVGLVLDADVIALGLAEVDVDVINSVGYIYIPVLIKQFNNLFDITILSGFYEIVASTISLGGSLVINLGGYTGSNAGFSSLGLVNSIASSSFTPIGEITHSDSSFVKTGTIKNLKGFSDFKKL